MSHTTKNQTTKKIKKNEQNMKKLMADDFKERRLLK
jgi:hypothetical protein